MTYTKKVNLDIQTPRVFAPLLRPSRYKGVHGGRGSGKSHFFAELLIEKALLETGLKAVGLREIQKSIQFSVKEILAEKIRKFNAEKYFDIQDKCIKTPGDGIIIFQGLQNHTVDSIKSLQGFKYFWAEEAQSLSAVSLKKLRPTLREPGSELWASWNPEQPDDPIDKFLRDPANNSEDFNVLQANWSENPWFPKELELERQIDLRRNPDDYNHIWEGGYLARSEARVFRNWRVEEFETPGDARFYFGADWGFSKDPTTLVRMFIEGRTLYIDYEAYQVGCAIDKTPDLFDQVPESRKWSIRADNARPETIDYMQRNGFPKMVRSTKGKNSVNDGIEFIKSYDVVIHPRCIQAIKEFTHYSYKIDPKTDEVLPELEDDDNHIIDPVRYALELVRKAERSYTGVSSFGPKILGDI